MPESPYEVAALVEREAPESIAMDEFGERVVDAVLAQTMVIHPADTSEGCAQIDTVAESLYVSFFGSEGLAPWPEQSEAYRELFRADARAALDALRGGSGG